MGTLGTDLFVRRMPDSPDDCITVYDETGVVLDQNHYDNSDSFGTMIKVRGSYSFVKDKMLAIHRSVAGLGDVWLDNLYILDTRIQTPPASIGNDDKGRAEYTVHYIHYTKIFDNENRKGLSRLTDDSGELLTDSEGEVLYG